MRSTVCARNSGDKVLVALQLARSVARDLADDVAGSALHQEDRGSGIPEVVEADVFDS